MSNHHWLDFDDTEFIPDDVASDDEPALGSNYDYSHWDVVFLSELYYHDSFKIERVAHMQKCIDAHFKPWVQAFFHDSVRASLCKCTP